MKRLVLIVGMILFTMSSLYAQMPNLMIPPFSVEMASKFSSITMACLDKEYPNNNIHLMDSDSDVLSPSKLHPAFYGNLNWHSSVHAHWLLVKLIIDFPELKDRDKIIAAIDKHLTPENIAAEVAYFSRSGRACFERPYGWSWLLKLSSELARSDEKFAKKWFQNLAPLADVIKKGYYDYLPGLYYPIRRGSIDNTAFGIALAYDYAVAVGDKTFETFLAERAKFYFYNDNNVPANWEPEGEDLFSPSLIEADLMRRILTKEQFVRWFKDFMPEIPFSLIYPAVVANRKDPKGVNLDGLNLSRAWCMFELAKVLPDDSQSHRDLWQAGYRHAAEALPNVLSDNCSGSQWLATFAVYMYESLSNVQQ